MLIFAKLAFLAVSLLKEQKAAEAPRRLKPYTLVHFIAWIDSHDPSETYNWDSGYYCLIGQYANSVHAGHYWSEGHLKFMRAMPDSWSDIFHIARDEPRIFGGALSRARALEATWQSK